MSDGELLKAWNIYKNRWNGKHDPERCRASTGSGYFSHQCNNKPKVFREVLHHGEKVNLGFCGTHDPAKVKERRAAHEAKWRAKWAAQEKLHKKAEGDMALREAALKAIRSIAAGHNDPRGLAIQVLAEHEPTDSEMETPHG